MTTEQIKGILDVNVALRDNLFAYGFLFTDSQVNEKEYPFYDNWEKKIVNQYTLLVHKKQKSYVCSLEQNCFVLIGHAYNPFTLQYEESEIVQELLSFWVNDKNAFFDKFNQISGIFTLIILDESGVHLLGDPSCIQTTYYGKINENIIVSTHSRLIGDLMNLKEDEYVKRLINYKHFRLFGNYLPGDLSPFGEIKRLVPNHCVTIGDEITVRRFYAIETTSKGKDDLATEIGEVLHNSLKMISKKWNHVAISLTGGCDSKTTLACANGLYEKFSYFSYISVDKEKVDAKAAQKICENLGLKHKTYEISSEDDDFDNLDLVREILFWNGGGTLYNNANDIRKRCYFSSVNDFDVEVKSWCSEIGRAYYSKRFNGRKRFGKTPSPRKCTTLYKVFLSDRKLVRKTDKIFKDYIKTYFNETKNSNVPWQEQFFWEFRVPAWNGLTITGEHRYSFDIAIPYNNRKLLCLFLSASIEQRIGDEIYKLVRYNMNEKVDSTGVLVQNIEHTKKRAIIENLYYAVHTKIPF